MQADIVSKSLWAYLIFEYRYLGRILQFRLHLLLGLLPQHPLQDLPRCRLRHFIQKHHTTLKPLIPRQPPLQKPFHLPSVNACPCFPFLFTTYALGSSPACSSISTPITATSTISGWLSNTFSISGGATWKPRTLISSFLRSTMYQSLEDEEQRTMSPVW